MNKHNPILITGIQRSGASIIAKIIALSGGVFTGNVNSTIEHIGLNAVLKEFYVNLQVDPSGQYPLPDFTDMEMDHWDSIVHSTIEQDGYKNNMPWIYKNAKILQTMPMWYANFPNAKFVIVRRRPADVIESCVKTGYMTAFKNEKLRNKLGFKTEKEGWLWWIQQQDEMLKTFLTNFKVDYRVIWPERMCNGDYSQIYEMLQWLELEWNSEIVCMTKKVLWKSKYKEGMIDECNNN